MKKITEIKPSVCQQEKKNLIRILAFFYFKDLIGIIAVALPRDSNRYHTSILLRWQSWLLNHIYSLG